MWHLVTASIDIVLHPNDGEGADILIRSAGMTMYRAKAEGRNRYERYVPAMNAMEPSNWQ